MTSGPSLHFSAKDYQNFLQQQQFLPAAVAAAPPSQQYSEIKLHEEIQTPGIKYSQGYPQMQMQGSAQKNNRSMSTGLKPATAVRLKSLPWNLAPINYEVATTATSHSRRTTDNMPIHKQF